MIAAMANNRVIGKDNDMPWHLPADLAHFKKVTMAKPILMGRKTFESIGRPLPGRKNVVITRNENWCHDGVECYSSIESALSALASEEEIMIVGGGHIYQQLLPQADVLHLTFIDLEVDGDTQFPDWTEAGQWIQVSIEDHLKDHKNPHNYQFVELHRAK